MRTTELPVFSLNLLNSLMVCCVEVCCRARFCLLKKFCRRHIRLWENDAVVDVGRLELVGRLDGEVDTTLYLLPFIFMRINVATLVPFC